jgi:hypothetical protein
MGRSRDQRSPTRADECLPMFLNLRVFRGRWPWGADRQAGDPPVSSDSFFARTCVWCNLSKATTDVQQGDHREGPT